MAKSKSSKSDKPRDPFAANHSRVIKAGVYDGSQRSTDFVVSGHSTGSPYTEMEALSHQVSRDVGAVPDYPTDDNYRIQKATTDIGSTIPEDSRDTSDLGGPALYGPEPSLLKDSPDLDLKESSIENNKNAADAGIYKHEAANPTPGSLSSSYESASKSNDSESFADSFSATEKLTDSVSKVSGSLGNLKSYWRVAMWSTVGIAGAALAGIGAYKAYSDPQLRRN